MIYDSNITDEIETDLEPVKIPPVVFQAPDFSARSAVDEIAKGPGRGKAKRQKRVLSRVKNSYSETEILPRRKVDERIMLVRGTATSVQIGVLEDGILVEHYVARGLANSMVGNVYMGRVQNVLPGMEAAFVDIGRGRNAVLYSGEVSWEGVKSKKIEQTLKAGDSLLVQVTKDPVMHKGARLTTQISLAGRYLVHVPGVQGISRRIDSAERTRLKKILKSSMGDVSSLIVRTAAAGATEEQLIHDAQTLFERYQEIKERSATAQVPSLVYAEPDLLIRLLRDIFNNDFKALIIENSQIYKKVCSYLKGVSPDMLERVIEHKEKDLFDEYRVNEQLEKALSRKVLLPSGGSLVIDHTEAMTVIDVNTGKFVGTGGNLEQTVTENNLEAVEEIVRQLRLRDLGGIVVIDFIDMLMPENRDLVYRRLLEALAVDRTRHQVAEITSLGLVQMTRKKLGLGLDSFAEVCSRCEGQGRVIDIKVVSGRASRGRKKQAREVNQTASNVAVRIASAIAAEKNEAAESGPVDQAPETQSGPGLPVTGLGQIVDVQGGQGGQEVTEPQAAAQMEAAQTETAPASLSDAQAFEAPTEQRGGRNKNSRRTRGSRRLKSGQNFASPERDAEAAGASAGQLANAAPAAKPDVSLTFPADSISSAKPTDSADSMRDDIVAELYKLERTAVAPGPSPAVSSPVSSAPAASTPTVSSPVSSAPAAPTTPVNSSTPGKRRNRRRRLSTSTISTENISLDAADSGAKKSDQ